MFILLLASNGVYAQYTATNLETGNQNVALAKDANGNIYTTRFQSAGLYKVVKYTNGTGSPTDIYTGLPVVLLDYPLGLAVAGNGDVYVSSSVGDADGKIIRLDASNGYNATIVQTGRYFTGLAFDNQNRLYALEYNSGNYAVVRYSNPSIVNSAGTNLYSSIPSAQELSYPTSISVATDGTIYFNNVFNIDGGSTYKGGIVKLTTTNGITYTKADLNTTNYTSALYIDEFNNLYAIESPAGTYKLYKYTGGVGPAVEFYSAAFSAGYPYLAYGITAHNNTVYAIDGDNGSAGSRLLKLAPNDVTPPSVPASLAAASAGGSRINLNWTANAAGENISGYRIYGGTTPEPTQLIASIPTGTTTYTQTGLTAGQQYYYRISAVDIYFNESNKSTDVSAVPKKPVITSATFDASNKQLTITGTDFLTLTGATNDILVSKLTLKGENGATRVLTTGNVEITNNTTFSVILNAGDQVVLNPILNKNGTSSTGGTTYNLAVATGWAAGEDISVNIAQAAIPVIVSNVAIPTITSANYNASTGTLVVTGTGLLALAGNANDIVANKFTIRGEGGSTYSLTDTQNADIGSGTSFTLTLSATDRAGVNLLVNKNGTSSTDLTTYNLAAAEDWNIGADIAVVIADLTGNGIMASNVAIPTITSAAYDASTGSLVVTGTGFLSSSGANNDIVANKFRFTGEGTGNYTLTDTQNAEITSGTSFTLTLSATDRAAVNLLVNKNGTSSTGGTTYNLAAAEDWNAGADIAVVIADLTGNGITVSNVGIPTITSATYDASTGSLVVIGTDFLKLNGANNDIIANKFRFTGEGTGNYTLTDTQNAEITSGTSFTLTLSATDRAAVNLLVNKNGTSSTGGTTYNLAATEDWNAGADAAVVIADLTGNGITVSNVAAPNITSATYNATTGILVVTGSNFLKLDGAANDIVARKFRFIGDGGNGYSLTDTQDTEITSGTSFTLTLSATDKAGVNQILNKNGATSTGGTTYNLAAAEDWNAGADPTSVIEDLIGNGVTVSGVALPSITSATYDFATGTFVVTASNLLSLSGANNDIIANKFTFKGEGAAIYTLTNTSNVDIISATTFTLVLSATDKAGVNLLATKNGTSSNGGTIYNLAAAEDWNAGADAALTIADLTNAVTVANYESPLPIELVSFSHKKTNTEIVLNWSTSAESNNKEFKLYRSLNGIDFNIIGTVAGAGNSSQLRNYTFTDSQPIIGTSYYKLTQIDRDNTVKLEKIIPVSFQLSADQVVVYPNPVLSQLYIKTNNLRFNKAIISDVSGKIMGVYNITSNDETLNLTNLPKGLYFLNLTGDNGKIVKKIIKN